MRLLHPETPWVDDERGEDELVVAITRDELAGLGSAVNEALEAVEEWEFETRVGLTPEDAIALHQRIHVVLRETYRPE